MLPAGGREEGGTPVTQLEAEAFMKSKRAIVHRGILYKRITMIQLVWNHSEDKLEMYLELMDRNKNAVVRARTEECFIQE